MDLPVLKTQRLYQQISRLLIQYIREGRFPPGQVLPAERDLAKQLGVSRSSVREALIALEISGWVEIRVGNGVFVRAPLPEVEPEPAGDDVSGEDLLKAREIVEGEVAALAAKQATAAQLEALGLLADNMQNTPGGDKSYHNLDMKFHLSIAEMTKNSVLVDVVERLWQKNYSPIFLGLQQHYADEGLEVVWDRDHDAIVRALQNRDSAAARTAMRRHLRHVFERLFQPTK